MILPNNSQRLLDKIRPQGLKSEHIEDIAKLHFQELAWSFNGRFGKAHITELYRALFGSSKFFGYVFYSDGKLIGFVTATEDWRDTRQQIMKVYRKKPWQVMRIFCRFPRFAIAAFESRFVVPRVFGRVNARGEWLTFITDTRRSYLSPIVAIRLIEKVKTHFRERNIPIYVAQGFKNNPKAIQLYEKLQWEIVAKLPIHNVYLFTTTDSGMESNPQRR